MSMIAKMSITKATQYGQGTLFELQCIAANETMAMYAGSEEDKLFSTASPSGEMQVHQPAGFVLGRAWESVRSGDQFYVMCVAADEPRAAEFPGASAWIKARCASLTDFGGTSKQLSFCASSPAHYRKDGETYAIENFAWKMSVDNPLASGQIKPGETYWIALYPVAEFTRDQAIAAAHGG